MRYFPFEDARELIVQYIERSAGGGVGRRVTDATDLLQDGLIDSFGFVELIDLLELASGTELHLEKLPPADIARVGALAALAATNETTASA
jgi:acyl carrier protein